MTDPDLRPPSAAPGTLDTDYQSTIFLKAPAEAVFDALTTLTGLAGWWTNVSGSGQKGGELRFVFGDAPQHQSQDLPVEAGDGAELGGGEVLVIRVDEAERPAIVRWTVLASQLQDWVGTAISFELTPRSDGGGDLSFRHRGLTPRLECYKDCKNGWDHFIPSLRDYVDTGAGSPFASPADIERREARRRLSPSAE